MNSITLINTSLTMTSREIAELTEKEHRNVVADIRKMFAELEINDAEFSAPYTTSQGNTYTEYRLDQELTYTLVAGYNIKLRNVIIKRWQELEAQNQKPSIENLSRLDILQLAMQSEQERLRLEQQTNELKGKTLELQQQIETEAPRVAFAKQVEVAPDAISVGKAAKIIGTGQQRLFAFLRQLAWITRYNEPYQDKINAGYLDVKLGSFQHPSHGLKQSVTPLITGKGLVKLQQLWNKRQPQPPLFPEGV